MKKITILCTAILFLTACGKSGITGTWMLDEQRTDSFAESSTFNESDYRDFKTAFLVTDIDIKSSGYSLPFFGETMECEFSNYSQTRATGICKWNNLDFQSSWVKEEQNEYDELRWRINFYDESAIFVYRRAN